MVSEVTSISVLMFDVNPKDKMSLIRAVHDATSQWGTVVLIGVEMSGEKPKEDKLNA